MTKAELFERLDALTRAHDVSLTRDLNVVLHPGQFGWRRSATAASKLPLNVIGATLTDATYILTSRVRWPDK